MSVQSYILPIILGIFGLLCIFTKKDLQAPFTEGAKEGLAGAFSLIPVLVILMTSISMFNASGASELITKIISPIMKVLKIPSALSPLLVVRPLSGSGSTAVLSDIFERYGPDSAIGLSASVLCASSDTVFYIVSLYMSSASIKRTRHALPVAITVSILGAVLSCVLVRIVF